MTLVEKLVQVSRVLTGRQDAGRNLTVYADDLFIVSYPRSGNNWTRFLIGNLIHPNEPVTFANLERLVPEIYFNSDRQLRALPRPRVFKSHEAFEPHYPHIVYVVRDPRDVAVSNYHHNQKAGNIPTDCKIEDFIPMFLAGRFDKKCGTWGDHVTSWLATRENDPSFLLVRYEDLKVDPFTELARVSRFLGQCGFPVAGESVHDLQQAVELSSASRMRALEAIQGRDWTRSHYSRAKKPYLAVREALSGGWKSALPSHCVAQIEDHYGALMRKLGYEESKQIGREAIKRGKAKAM